MVIKLKECLWTLDA